MKGEEGPTSESEAAASLRLQQYLQRIGYQSRLLGDARTLRGLHRAHVMGIPFENIDVVLHGTVSLTLDDIANKLVRRRRGGYCYEHTLLFAEVVKQLRMPVILLAARVRMGSQKLRPRTHAMLKARADGQDWLADVGFGGGGLLEPIPFARGAENRQGGWTFRLDQEDRYSWVLRSKRPDGWVDVYSFSEEPQTMEDFRVLNHYMSTHPHSPFVGRLHVQRAHASTRVALHGLELTTSQPDGGFDHRRLEAGDLPETLKKTFGIILSRAEVRSLKSHVQRAMGPGAPSKTELDVMAVGTNERGAIKQRQVVR